MNPKDLRLRTTCGKIDRTCVHSLKSKAVLNHFIIVQERPAYTVKPLMMQPRANHLMKV